ncbi:MAG: hypothetical protein R3E89_09275 [Thiolinea sp.]
MNRTLYCGTFNNAGAIGSMPLPKSYAADTQRGSNTVQLINCASRYLLNNRLKQNGLEPDTTLERLAAQYAANLPDAAHHVFENWVKQAAPAIAYAIASSVSIIDFEGVIIDGLLPSELTARLTNAVSAAINNLDTEGLVLPKLVAGTIGNDARALGGAFLPFYTNFTPDRSILISGENSVFHDF